MDAKKLLVHGNYKLYNSHLNEQFDQDETKNWFHKSDDLLVDLLFSISKEVGYFFDKVTLKKGIYSPKAHTELENWYSRMRDGLEKFLSGKQPLPMTLVIPNETLLKQTKLQDSLIDYFDGKRTLKLRLKIRSNYFV